MDSVLATSLVTVIFTGFVGLFGWMLSKVYQFGLVVERMQSVAAETEKAVAELEKWRKTWPHEVEDRLLKLESVR